MLVVSFAASLYLVSLGLGSVGPLIQPYLDGSSMSFFFFLFFFFCLPGFWSWEF